MKLFAIVIPLCALTLGAFAQKSDKEISDAVSLRCYYLLSKKKTASEKPYRQDTMILDIGDKVSRFYDPARLGRDSAISQLMRNTDRKDIKSFNVYKGDKAKDFSKVPGTRTSNMMEGESYQIIKEKKTNTVTVFDYVNGLGAKFQFEDKFPKLNWELAEGTDTIATYACQKATLKFRGRNYTAWFTPDIPISDGPWKFSGLPGLILKVEDTDQLFSFSLIGMTQPKTPLPIAISKSDYLKCTRAEFEKQLKKQGLGMQVNIADGVMSISEIVGIYDPVSIELE